MHTLDDILRQIDRFPTLPDVALRVARKLEDDDVALDQIAEMIALDQSLAGRIIKLANSALYGSNRPAESLRAAMLRLGTREIRAAVLAVAVMEVLPPLPPPYSLRAFWVQSLGSALIGRMVAKDLGYPDPEEAYLAALVHLIGEGFLSVLFTKRFESALSSARSEGLPLAVGLVEEFGCDQAEVGSRLLAHWNFPLPILEAVRHQLHPDRAGGNALLASIVFAADHIARDAGLCIEDPAYETGAWVAKLPAPLEERISRSRGIKVQTYLERLSSTLDEIEAFANSVFKA